MTDIQATLLDEIRSILRIGVAFSQYQIGERALKFIGTFTSRSEGVKRLRSELNQDVNLYIRTHLAIKFLHGEDIQGLPPIGHFHKAWNQLVKKGSLLPGAKQLYGIFKDRCLREIRDAVDGFLGKKLHRKAPNIEDDHGLTWLQRELRKSAKNASPKDLIDLLYDVLAGRSDADMISMGLMKRFRVLQEK